MKKTQVCKYCLKRQPIKNFQKANVIKGVTYYRLKCTKCKMVDQDKRRLKLSEFITEIKKKLQCNDCGNSDYRVIQFHHIRDKDFNIAEASKRGLCKEKILKEIEKCIPLCANCHSILHFEERNNR